MCTAILAQEEAVQLHASHAKGHACPSVPLIQPRFACPIISGALQLHRRRGAYFRCLGQVFIVHHIFSDSLRPPLVDLLKRIQNSDLAYLHKSEGADFDISTSRMHMLLKEST